jgi:hypothetical protein
MKATLVTEARVMRLRISPAHLAAVGLFAGPFPVTAALAQGAPFEGVVTIRVSDPDGGKPVTAKHYITKNALRFETVMGGNQPHFMIFDHQRKQVISVMPQQRMYMVMPIPDTDEADPGMAKKLKESLTKTGKSETIAGYRCEHWLIKDDDDQYDACVTGDLGAYLEMQGRMGGGRNPMSGYNVLGEQRVFPLRMSQVGGRTIYEVTNIEKKPLDASLFQPPAGYRKMEMPTMGGQKP